MNSTISEYIKTSRLELGLTQDELAQRAGISVRYLCDIENDHGIPSDWVYESLQQALSNHEQNRMKWGAQLRKTRRTYGVEQEWFALQLGMTTKQLRALETGKTELPYQKRFEIMSAIERFNPENEPLSIMFDYMRIRFKTTDARYVLEKILRLNMKYVISEDGGVYGYSYRFTHETFLFCPRPMKKRVCCWNCAGAAAVSLSATCADRSGRGMSLCATVPPRAAYSSVLTLQSTTMQDCSMCRHCTASALLASASRGCGM